MQSKELTKQTEAQRAITLIDKQSEALAEIIKDNKYGMVVSSQIKNVKYLLNNDKKLAQAALNDPVLFTDAVEQATLFGLSLAPSSRQAYLIQKKDKDTNKSVIDLRIGAQGYVSVGIRTGIIKKIEARLVCTNDNFSWSGDSSERPAHQWDFFSREARGSLKGAYTVTTLKEGDLQVYPIGLDKIYSSHRDRSSAWKAYVRDQKSGKKPKPPVWITDEDEMVLKTVIIAAHKEWPAMDNEAYQRLYEMLEQDYNSEMHVDFDGQNQIATNDTIVSNQTTNQTTKQDIPKNKGDRINNVLENKKRGRPKKTETPPQEKIIEGERVDNASADKKPNKTDDKVLKAIISAGSDIGDLNEAFDHLDNVNSLDLGAFTEVQVGVLMAQRTKIAESLGLSDQELVDKHALKTVLFQYETAAQSKDKALFESTDELAKTIATDSIRQLAVDKRKTMIGVFTTDKAEEGEVAR